MSSRFYDIEGDLSPDVNSSGIMFSRYANLPTPEDAKSCNYFQLGNSVVVETIAEYLERMIAGTRSLGHPVTVILPIYPIYEILAEYDMAIWGTESANFEPHYYAFIGGLANENFVEIPNSSAYVYIAYASDAAGAGWSLTPTDLLKYRAEIHSVTPKTPVVGDFGGAIWVKYIGDDGGDGAQGIQGIQGPAGGDGAQGIQGIQGADGPQGPVGADGAQGIQGIQGADGPQGPAGADGREVEIDLLEDGNIAWRYVGDIAWTNIIPISALTGPEGIQGIQGADGIQGPAGADGGSIFDVHFIFDAAGAINYPCPYALKYTAMIHQQATAPTLSHALNTDMAQYTNFVMTANAAGIVTLTGTWL